MAEKIIYTKYSNDRMKIYRIMTQIMQSGEYRYVRKSAMEKESVPHILKLLSFKKRLDVMFEGTKFVTNEIIDFSDNSVDFDFCDGIGYDKMLDAYISRNDEAGFKEAILHFFMELDKCATVSFKSSSDVIRIFGGKNFLEGEPAIPVGNIDLLFGNILVTKDGRWNVIDYEWCFDFALPVEYVKWRALFIYTVSSRKHSKFVLKIDRDFTEEELNFQKYIGNAKFVEKTHIFRKAVLNPFLIESRDHIDVFYDTGEGFSERQKDVFYQFPVLIYTPKKLQRLRIDPSCHFCFVRGISIKSDDSELTFITNAYYQNDGLFFFDTMDPQIYVELPRCLTKTFLFDMQVFCFDEQTALAIKKEYEKSVARAATIEAQHATIENMRAVAADFRDQLQQQILQADVAIRQKSKELSSLYASRSWRLTKPFRMMGQVVRRAFRKR